MFAVSLALLLQVEVAPSLPAGCNEWLHKSVTAVTDALEKKDFAKASVLVTRLPRREITVEWNDTNVPAIRRQEFIQARQDAFATWQAAFPDLKFKIGSPAQMKVSFTETLPVNTDSSGPAGAVLFASSNLQEVNVEAILALRRTERKHSVEPRDVANEMRYAIGYYLGLERTIATSGVMTRTDLLNNTDSNLAPIEVGVTKAILRVADALREATAKSKPLQTAKPMLFAEPGEIKTDKIVQGDVANFSLTVTNRGNSLLNFRVVPDCGCLLTGGANSLQPGESGLVQVGVLTSQFIGEVQKNLFIYSNDAEVPVRRIPVHLNIEPYYRFIRNRPHDVLIPSGNETKETIYLLVNERAPFTATDISVTGRNVSAKISPWDGEIADPELNLPKQRRKGYKIDLLITGEAPPGRNTILIAVKTNSDKFPILSYNLFTQSGIERSPQTVYLGEIPNAPKRAWILLSRPRIGFKIEKVVTSHPSLKATFEAVRDDWEYKIIVQFLGKAQRGTFIETVDIYTDDPKQRVIHVPVQAIIQ